jgi:hypothetical protein
MPEGYDDVLPRGWKRGRALSVVWWYMTIILALRILAEAEGFRVQG